VQPIPAGKGIVYVYQSSPGTWNYDINRVEVFINNNVVGCVQGKEYMAFQCTPGPVAVSTGLNVAWQTIDMNTMTSVSLDVRPGGQYYVRVQFSMPFLHNPTVVPTVVADDDALGQLKECTLGEPGKGLADVLSGDVTPGVNLNDIKSVYVIQNKEDATTAPLVADRLRALGYAVRTGPAREMPPGTQCLVKIQEQWFWDTATYLLELRADLIDPRIPLTFASGTVRRVAPYSRRPAEIMATEVVNAMFNGGRPPGVDVAPQAVQP
jgi:hypothetical protein